MAEDLAPILRQLLAEQQALREQLAAAPAELRRRGLCEGDLVTVGEIRAALRCSRERAEEIVSHLPAVQPGSAALYRWGKVLALVEGRPIQAALVALNLPRKNL